MPDTERIVLTTDLSDQALAAFRPAGDLARSLGATITVLHVVPIREGDPSSSGSAHEPTAGSEAAERAEAAHWRLEEQSAAIGPDVPIELEIVVAHFVPGAIVEFARDSGADLIAMSTHGRSGIARLVLGSVAEQVLRSAEIPVICYPPPSS
jgi:nucleotide-binding universal stress UspA family protein